MNITRLPDALLLDQTDFLVQQERKTIVMILQHLQEIEVHRLYIELGYSFMHKYCIQKLEYSEGQAYRRLTSARLMTELSEIEPQIQAGDLNLTNLSKIQSYVPSEKAANCFAVLFVFLTYTPSCRFKKTTAASLTAQLKMLTKNSRNEER